MHSKKEAIYWLFFSFYFFIWFDFSFLTRNWLPTSLKGFCLTVLEWLEDRSTQPENKRTGAQVDSTLNVEGGRQEMCSQELSALGMNFFTLFFYCFLFVCLSLFNLFTVYLSLLDSKCVKLPNCIRRLTMSASWFQRLYSNQIWVMTGIDMPMGNCLFVKKSIPVQINVQPGFKKKCKFNNCDPEKIIFQIISML